jgi:hypothetical protein
VIWQTSFTLALVAQTCVPSAQTLHDCGGSGHMFTGLALAELHCAVGHCGAMIWQVPLQAAV